MYRDDQSGCLPMYVPSHFKEDRPEVLRDIIRNTGLAVLVSMTPDGLLASHVPLLLDPEPAPYGTLIGHFARQNPHGRVTHPDAQESLAIFQGPEGYITPSWYATKQETGKVVPTWNYVAVHAYGRLQIIDDPDRLLAIVTRLTDRHESARHEPWAVSDAPADFVRGMLKGIVGFALPVSRLEGKVKMSQNRPPADQHGVVAGLANAGQAELAARVAQVARLPKT